MEKKNQWIHLVIEKPDHGWNIMELGEQPSSRIIRGAMLPRVTRAQYVSKMATNSLREIQSNN